MSGNVCEWYWDLYGGYCSGNQVDPMGRTSGPFRVICGGSFYDEDFSIKVAFRHYGHLDISDVNIGFHLVLPILK